MRTGIPATKHSWWSGLNKTLLNSEASQFLQDHGDRACEVARKATRAPRNKGEHRQARHYSHLALRITELSAHKLTGSGSALSPPVGLIELSKLLYTADEVLE
jgi:hypothetical protein